MRRHQSSCPFFFLSSDKSKITSKSNKLVSAI
nr:MAG TPA: hypothetical protein [Crassvirales sp.]